MAVDKEKKTNEIEDPEIDIHGLDGDTRDNVYLQTHEDISRDLCGELVKLERGYIESRLIPNSSMVVDGEGMIHAGFIFGAADFAAMACVNEPNVVLVGSDCQFLSPVKIGSEVNFVARVRHKEGRKRNVHVEGFVLDIKVFEGEFKTVVTERHVLRLKLLEDINKD